MLEYVDRATGEVVSVADYRAGLCKGPVRLRMVGFEPSVVDESKLAEADLNILVKRWMRGEPVPQFAPEEFGDVSDAGSFMEMQEKLLVVKNAFERVPAHMREHFGNSAVVFADALVDPARKEELVQLGLFAPEPEPVVVVAPPPAGPIVVPL